ncbi:MAG TPA: hypothetical protein VNT55_14010, partial [Baekduia sp.]|nr:hypothetical protein [Baekduia sp.]
DRPARTSGTQEIGAFVAGWARTFRGAAPNAAVTAPAGPRGHHPTAVDVLGASYDAAHGTVTFTLALGERRDAARAAWLARLTRATRARNGRVVLFLDGGGAPTLNAQASSSRADAAQAQAALDQLAQSAGATPPAPPAPAAPSP